MHLERATPARLWGVLFAAAAIIAGILGMHTLSAGSAHGHGSAPSEVSAVMHGTDHDAAMHASAPLEEQSDGAAPVPDHSAAAMACVLALLLTLLLVAPVALFALQRRLGVARSTDLARACGVLTRARAPSLLTLSISRT